MKSGSRTAARPASRGSGWEVVLTSLFVTRFFVPAEASDRGVTLWIAAAWWWLSAARCWWLWRHEVRVAWRPTLLDAGVLALVGGHLLSGGLVLLGEGDQRGALNLMWEWSSLIPLYVCLKVSLDNGSFRELLARAFLTTVLCLSCLGVWQHFVWLPQQSSRVQELLELHQKLERNEPLAADERRRYDALAGEIGADVLTLDSSGRMMFLSRVRDSVEPIGRFALANTFAALLAVGMVWLFDRVGDRGDGDKEKRVSFFTRIGTGILVGTNLLLTKSRTAWIGAACGGIVLAVLRWRGHRRFPSRLVIGGSIALILVVVLTVSLWSVGGLDREVLSEAPKSFRYRLEYWQATAALLVDHPLFGVGPGNFRQHYLRYKLAGSSEEILDPHNLFLDAWANGGLVGLAGLLILIVVLLTNVVTRTTQTPSVPLRVRFPTSTMISGLISLGAVFAIDWLFWGHPDEIVLGLAVIWCLAAPAVQFGFPVASVTSSGALACGATLLIHLLGAGGMGMPAVVQLLLLLLLLSGPSGAVTCDARTASSTRWSGAALVLSLTAAVGSLWSGVVPVVGSGSALATGNHLMVVRGQYRPAESMFGQAAELDTLSPEPWQQLATLLWLRWQAGGGRDDDLFSSAVAAQREAIARDPVGPNRYRTLAEWWMRRYELTADVADAAQGAETFREAVSRYPQHAQLRAQYALALDAARRDAAADARHALHLDDLNRTRGHFEKVLPETLRLKLEQILSRDGPAS